MSEYLIVDDETELDIFTKEYLNNLDILIAELTQHVAELLTNKVKILSQFIRLTIEEMSCSDLKKISQRNMEDSKKQQRLLASH